MYESDVDRINTAIEGEIRKYASKVELDEDGTVLRVTIPDSVVMDQQFPIQWWLDFIGADMFQWNGRTFYCCDVEPAEDEHTWLCYFLDLPDDFSLRTAQEVEIFRQGQLEHQDVPEA
jgi:hypothetical protein